MAPGVISSRCASHSAAGPIPASASWPDSAAGERQERKPSGSGTAAEACWIRGGKGRGASLAAQGTRGDSGRLTSARGSRCTSPCAGGQYREHSCSNGSSANRGRWAIHGQAVWMSAGDWELAPEGAASMNHHRSLPRGASSHDLKMAIFRFPGSDHFFGSR
jgi:hypothetical protein